MSLDARKNFCKVLVSTGYNASATSIVLASGDGSKLPTAPFNLTWFDGTTYSDPSDDPNVEIVRVTNIATDTLTITRAQEGTSAATHNTALSQYEMILGVTKKTLDDIDARTAVVQVAYASTVTVDASTGGTFELAALTGNLTLANPTNPIDGQVISFIVPQDSTGSRTVTLGNNFIIPSSATSPLSWSTAANVFDILAAKYRASTQKWEIVSFVFGYPNS